MLTERLFCSIMFYMNSAIQLKMPHTILENVESPQYYDSLLPKTLFPGSKVLYIGNLRGGPQTGSSGTVLKAGQNKVLVDFKKENNWYIPKFLLRSLN